MLPVVRVVGVGLAICLIAIAAGCNSPQASTSPSPAITPAVAPTTSDLPGSSQPAGIGTQPVSMTLLPNWRKIELTDAGLRGALDQASASNPLLAKTLQALLQSGGYLRFALYAIGYDGDRYIGNVNVAESPLAGLGLEAMGPLLESQLRGLGGQNIETTQLTLPEGPAVRLSYTLAVPSGTSASPTGTATVTGRLFVFLVNGITYDVTFTCGGPDPSACLVQADQMIQTFRIGS